MLTITTTRTFATKGITMAEMDALLAIIAPGEAHTSHGGTCFMCGQPASQVLTDADGFDPAGTPLAGMLYCPRCDIAIPEDD